MVERDRALGGYDPHAGLSAHEADQPRFNPVPSLLRSLLSEHLDPGYAAAAAQRAERPRWATRGWQAMAALLVAVVFAAGVAQARSTAPGVRETQRALLTRVRASEVDAHALTAQRAGLTSELDGLRRSQLEGDEQGQRLLRQLDELGLAAATTGVTGPGMTVTFSDPGVSPNLTDVSKERIPGSRQVVLDRDLQLVVNSLWASGAEAIAVDGVRIGPNATLRQAGGAILADNQPITSPYDIVAIGPPNGLRDAFERSDGFQRMRLLEGAYGVGVSLSMGDALTIPTGSSREVKYAKPIGG